jgi:hypothetical protein
MDSVLAFLSGIGVSLVAALVAHLLTRTRENLSRIREKRFRIYMKLLELRGTYIWVTFAELHREHPNEDTRRRCHSLAWQIADMLRESDDVEYLEDILEILLASGFPTAKARYDAMGQLLGILGKRVNPKYMKKVSKINSDSVFDPNMERKSNAPGAMW